MRNNLRSNLIFVALFWLAMIAGVQGVRAESISNGEPKTVVDFFLLVPEHYVGYPLDFRQELVRGERRGTVIDIKNGYISWNASDNPEEFEFTIFRKNNGKYIVAFSSPGEAELFPPRFFLLSYDNGRWRDVTRQLLPVAYDKRADYKLPQRGRSIVVSRNWRARYRLTWKNDRFRVDRRLGN